MIRRYLVERVRDRFNDRAAGQQPIQRSDNALLPPDSVAWRVHGDVTTMMVGGIAALLVEMLHPLALGGVWDHSKVASDQLGRLRMTARFIAITTYGERDQAKAAIERVRMVHSHVVGTLPDGRAYRADDPHLLNWIHVAGSIHFLDAWRRFGEPQMTMADQDRYFAEVAGIAEALGGTEVPKSRSAAEEFVAAVRSELQTDDRTRQFRDLVLKAPAARKSEAPVQALVMAAAVDLMPAWARAMHGLRRPPLSTPAVRLATLGTARTLRWAFSGGPR
ncbi:oxygenase MpaB family protein [Sphingomonas sp. LY29]|uniref:oxygenase MpaB family protein n=1 Tax=Sphingomonas sp. LY29 TaxID=3095341 RepID=UPI002D777754|nr:oxygenase MpaB family protein [Sphingomonas sp. LY29]WRP24819.1 oxygenase MpaB family protein [Sphingomonas sp. LY29]